MTDALPAPADRPSPARAIEAAFARIQRTRMQGLPMLNPALSVEAVGFRPWSEHWLGILITPWFMNLWLMPRVASRWQPTAERQTRHYVFPAGVFEFIGGADPALGDYQACSLFSPMFEFEAQAAARETALAALDALFDVGSRETTVPTRAEPVPPPVSKRAFLLGSPVRAGHGP